ncbi:MAG TPA: mannose-1-phosphate guanylyltransferase [Bacteroidaceae bacterium]|nr:mannose-1-phosphate guanylyltransferase [Bacteroidaceae bacterium]
MNQNTYCVIMAGGIGSRFWPLSRTERPKQFVDALGIGKTFIQLTYERFSSFISNDHFLVMTGAAYKDLVLEQLPMLKPEQVLCEPMRRNTAPCIAYAAYKLKSMNPDATMVVTPSDHYVEDVNTFETVIQESLDYAAHNDCLMTIGITPTFPATEYGYIQIDETDTHQTFKRVSAFKEKPELERAKAFLATGHFVWNSGMFVWSADSICKSLNQHLPDIATLFDTISGEYGTEHEQAAVNDAFEKSRSISIDYGVMERAELVKVRCAEFGWNDIGSWGALYTQLNKDEHNNVVAGNDVLITDTQSCLIKSIVSDKRVIVDGVENLLVIDTDDVLMICPRKDDNHVKDLIAKSTK